MLKTSQKRLVWRRDLKEVRSEDQSGPSGDSSRHRSVEGRGVTECSTARGRKVRGG